MRKQPRTIEEWREAALLAAALRLIEAARLYGLIKGGPRIDVQRVEEILDGARKRGIVPTVEQATQASLGLIAQYAPDA